MCLNVTYDIKQQFNICPDRPWSNVFLEKKDVNKKGYVVPLK